MRPPSSLLRSRRLALVCIVLLLIAAHVCAAHRLKYDRERLPFPSASHRNAARVAAAEAAAAQAAAEAQGQADLSEHSSPIHIDFQTVSVIARALRGGLQQLVGLQQVDAAAEQTHTREAAQSESEALSRLANAEQAAARIRPHNRVPKDVERLRQRGQLASREGASHNLKPVSMPSPMLSQQMGPGGGSLWPILVVGGVFLCCAVAIYQSVTRQRRLEKEQEEAHRRATAPWLYQQQAAGGPRPGAEMQPPRPPYPPHSFPPYDPRDRERVYGPPYAQPSAGHQPPPYTSAPVPGQPPPVTYGSTAAPYSSAAQPYASNVNPFPPTQAPPPTPASGISSHFGGLGGMAASGLGGLALGSLLGRGLGGGGGGGFYGPGFGYGHYGPGGVGSSAGYGGGYDGPAEFAAESGPPMDDVDLGRGGLFDADSSGGDIGGGMFDAES